jgi:hypothetical protein
MSVYRPVNLMMTFMRTIAIIVIYDDFPSALSNCVCLSTYPIMYKLFLLLSDAFISKSKIKIEVVLQWARTFLNDK